MIFNYNRDVSRSGIKTAEKKLQPLQSCISAGAGVVAGSKTTPDTKTVFSLLQLRLQLQPSTEPELELELELKLSTPL